MLETEKAGKDRWRSIKRGGWEGWMEVNKGRGGKDK